MRLCTMNECGRKHYARDLCKRHYDRWRIHGDPTVTKIDREHSEACEVIECSRPYYSRGLCRAHYARQWKHGDPLEGRGVVGDVDERLEQYTQRGEGCWLWTSYIDPQGYGRLSVDNVPLLAHRLNYERLVGPIPEGLELDHLCENPPCVRPDHLEPVTHAENMRRIHHREEVAS